MTTMKMMNIEPVTSRDPGNDPEDYISWDPDNQTIEGEGNYEDEEEE